MTSTNIEGAVEKMEEKDNGPIKVPLSNGDGQEAEEKIEIDKEEEEVTHEIVKVDTPAIDKPNGGNVVVGGRGRGRKRQNNNTSKSDSNDNKNSSSGGRNTQNAKRLRQNEASDSSSTESGSIDGKNNSSDQGKAPDSHPNSNNKASTDINTSDANPVIDTAASGSRVLEDSDAANLATNTTSWGCIGIGEWVFARWRDKNYYSGIIKEKGLNDTWNIHFEDNMDGVASEAHILPIKTIGVNVKAVYSPDNVFRPFQATVTGQKMEDEKVEYAIRCTGLTQTLLCKRKQLSLKESEAKELRKHYQSSLPKAADLSIDNILAGPRRRGVGSVSQSKKIVGGAFDASLMDESRDSGAGTPTPKKPAAANKTKTSNASSVSSESRDTNVDTATPSSVTTATPKPLPGGNSVHKEVPPKGVLKDSPKKSKSKDKGLFDGYQFFLTASGGGDPSSSGDDAQEPVLQYDKDEYKDSIESKGGKVIDSVGKEKGRDNVFLISDSHARTVKYIYCLAAGIPCVSHSWIGQCLEKNTVVDWSKFQLNSGWSLEEQRVIPAHQKKPLKNLKIYVTAEQDDLYNYWKPVLLAAEATLLKPKKKPIGVPPDTEILVTDSSCSQEVLDMVRRNSTPLVKPEWLVQTIITGTRASYSNRLKYHINPSGEIEDEEDD